MPCKARRKKLEKTERDRFVGTIEAKGRLDTESKATKNKHRAIKCTKSIPLGKM